MRKFAGALLVLGYLLSISGCRTSKQGYVAKGNKLFNAGKYEDAAINYNKAIQKDRNYGEAYYRLGLAEVKERNGSAAFNAFYRAVQLLPNDVDAKEQLGKLSLEFYMFDPHRPQAYYDLVKKMSSELLRRNPKSFEGLREEAYLAMTDKRREDAIALFRKAREVNPSDPAVSTALVQNLLAGGQSGEAERLGLDLIAHQSSYAQIYDVMYQWYVQENRPADAENIVKAKVSNNPKEGAYLLELAAHYDRVRKPAEMQATLQRLLDDPKDFPQARLWIGDLYSSLRNYPEAIHYYEDGARTSPNAQKALYQKRAVNALMAEGKRNEASTLVNQIVGQNPKDEEARRIQAGLLLRTGAPEKIAEAEHEFQDLSKERPNDASVWLGLGRAEALRGDLDQARARYLEALSKKPNYLQARFALAEIGLIQSHPDQTLQQADAILKVRPDDGRARLLRAQALARTGNVALARIEFTHIKNFQNSPQVQVELGLLALSDKKFQDAEQIFGKLSQSGDPRAIVGLAKTYTYEKQFDKAVEILNKGLNKAGSSTLLLKQLGETQAVAGKYDAAIATFQKVIALQPRSIETLNDLADVYTLQGDNNQAVTYYRQASGLAPNDAGIGLELAKALSQAGHVEEARTQYQSILKAHPDNPVALNNMAYFIWQNGGNLDEALGYSQQAMRISAQPSFLDTAGCIYLKKGRRDAAIQVFSNLVKKYPDHATFRFHLGMALLENGDKKGAKKELETALAAHPSRQDEARIKELLGKIS